MTAINHRAATGIDALDSRQQRRLETANMVLKTMAVATGMHDFVHGDAFARLGFVDNGEFRYIPANSRMPAVNLEGAVYGVSRRLAGFAHEIEVQRFLRGLSAFVMVGQAVVLDTVIRMVKRNDVDRTPEGVERLLASLFNEYRFAGVFAKPAHSDRVGV